MKNCVVYEYCENKISVLLMDVEQYPFSCGYEFMTYCAYTGKERHYIFLSELGEES